MIRDALLVLLLLVTATLHPIIMVMAADDELAPLVPPPSKTPNDELSPLVPPSDASDPSLLEGQQIRPASATVMAGHQLSLEIKNCFSYTPEGGSSYIECNPGVIPTNYEPAPLLPPFASSKWSVNGIEGGNGIVGRIKANGNKATYTAPTKVPTPATVAVSAEINIQGEGKQLVNAEITIVENVIHATVRFSGKREEHGEIIDYDGVAELDFVRADIFEGGVRYDLVANSQDTRVVINKWNMRSDSMRCSLKNPVTQPSLYIPYGGNFFIYSSLKSHTFSALLELSGMVKCKDGDSSYDMEISPRVLLTTSKGPPDLGLQPTPKDEKFSGRITLKMALDEDNEGSVTQTMEWFAKKY